MERINRIEIDMIKNLKMFLLRITQFEDLLKSEFEVDEVYNSIGKNIPRNGAIGSCEYNFHGGGCTFTLWRQKVSFNYYRTTQHKYTVTPKAFFEFLESSKSTLSLDLFDSNDRMILMQDLTSSGVLRKTKYSLANYEICRDKLDECYYSNINDNY